MIDLKLLIEQTEKTKKAILKKTFKGNLDKIIKMDIERRALMHEIEALKAEQNKISKEIATTEASKKKELLSKSAVIKVQTRQIEPKLAQLKIELETELLLIPNPALSSVPEGKDENDNIVIKTHGAKQHFDFIPLDHVALGKKHDLLDLQTASEISGTRFYYLKNEAVLLELALLQFVMQKLLSKDFKPILPPVLVKEKAMVATGFFPADENEIYRISSEKLASTQKSEDKQYENEDLFLVGTSEVPLCMLHANQILDPQKLPMRYAGFSTCFRREAGTWGKDTHGIIRVHQFDKVEMFSFCDPAKSEEEHEFILGIEEEIMQELGFCYQVVNICGGDLGNPAAKKYDIEVWIPTQGKFRELTSCSNCTDYQARRANIRYRKDKENRLVHTLNGTAVAISRTLVAILENYQQKDGSIAIPEVLRGYMGGKSQIGK